MKIKTSDEIDKEITRLYNDYLIKKYELILCGIEKNLYHIICDSDCYFNTKCCICAEPTETGNFIIKENKYPVCQACGLKYAAEKEIIEWKRKF